MIIPGILESEFSEVVKKVNSLQNKASLIHIDIIDGILLPTKTFLDLGDIEKELFNQQIELHLMVTDAYNYAAKKLLNVVSICAQLEGLNIDKFIKSSKENGYKTGLSISPNTPIADLKPYLNSIDFVQFMTVEPGAQGKPFRKDVINKIEKFKASSDIRIQVDGGIDEEKVKFFKALGIKNIVVGSKIFNQNNPMTAYKNLVKVLEDA
ncbi:MAG: hypothetical protein ACOZAO_00465 [Patescibacteria group bacterium]